MFEEPKHTYDQYLNIIAKSQTAKEKAPTKIDVEAFGIFVDEERFMEGPFRCEVQFKRFGRLTDGRYVYCEDFPT